MKRNYFSLILSLVLLCLPLQLAFGQGARYTGSYTKSDAIQHVGKSNFVIEGLDFTDSDKKYLIVLYSCENVIIRNNRFSNKTKLAIYLDDSKNVTIVDNTFDNVHTALIAHKSQGIKFDYNDIYNVGEPWAQSQDKNNGFVALFDKVTGPGNSISYNVAENIFGESSPGDIINVNQSHGTPESPIVVKGNWLRGGGPSPSGGGILIGDLGGSYQIAEDNILVDAGQYGIAIAGGSYMTLRNNKVYGKQQYFTNVGLYATNWYSSYHGQSTNITVENNAVNYTHAEGRQSNFWFSGNVEPIKGKETNYYDRNLNASILPDKIFGRARSGNDQIPNDDEVEPTPTPEPDPDTIPDPDKDPEPEPEPEPEPDTEPAPDDTDNPVIPGYDLPEFENHFTISIYVDRNNRVCVNTLGRLDPSAVIIAANSEGKIIYQQGITRFHTVLPYRPSPGTYHVYVKNGSRQSLKSLSLE